MANTLSLKDRVETDRFQQHIEHVYDNDLYIRHEESNQLYQIDFYSHSLNQLDLDPVTLPDNEGIGQAGLSYRAIYTHFSYDQSSMQLKLTDYLAPDQ